MSVDSLVKAYLLLVAVLSLAVDVLVVVVLCRMLRTVL